MVDVSNAKLSNRRHRPDGILARFGPFGAAARRRGWSLDGAAGRGRAHPADVDRMMTFTIDNNDEVGVMRCLGVEKSNIRCARHRGGGGSVATLVHAKKARWNRGCADVMVIWRAMNERSQYRFGQPALSVSPYGRSGAFLEWCHAVRLADAGGVGGAVGRALYGAVRRHDGGVSGALRC